MSIAMVVEIVGKNYCTFIKGSVM